MIVCNFNTISGSDDCLQLLTWFQDQMIIKLFQAQMIVTSLGEKMRPPGHEIGLATPSEQK
jgi:hypothetical protein